MRPGDIERLLSQLENGKISEDEGSDDEDGIDYYENRREDQQDLGDNEDLAAETNAAADAEDASDPPLVNDCETNESVPSNYTGNLRGFGELLESSSTTVPTPAPRAPESPGFQTSTPNYIGKKQFQSQINVSQSQPPTAPATPPTYYGEPTLTPPPRSPGVSSPPYTPASGDSRNHPPDGTSSDKSSETAVCGPARTPSAALSRKESYKAQRQHYRREKKRAASALLHSIEDPSVVVLSDWLKVRGSLKSWTKLWCVLKPGLLLLYKSPKAKSSHWVGTVLLTSCQVIERPSKKDGFCFKLYHPLEQSIWAPRGPHNETIGAVVQPLPTAHLIFRAPSQAAGHCWLDGLELALRCSNAMLRCSRNKQEELVSADAIATDTNISHEELEKHFNEHVLKLSKAFTCSSPTPLLSVSDYSPKRHGSADKKVSYQIPKKAKPSSNISKWAQFMESLEKMSKDNDGSTDSQTPDEKKDEKTFLDFNFLKRIDVFDRNTASTSSVRMISVPKTVKTGSKSVASSPAKSKIDAIKKSPILRCFELPKLQLMDKQKTKDRISPAAIIEANVDRIFRSLPKRRSSTPSVAKTNPAQKRISELRESGAKTDSENDDVVLKGYLPKGPKQIKSSEVLSQSPEEIVITKTAPSVERFRKYSSSSTDDVYGTRADFFRKPHPIRHTHTPEKFSLIDYDKLPSNSMDVRYNARMDDRVSSQNVYVAGQLVSVELAGATDSESEASRGMHAGPPPLTKQDVLARVQRECIEDQDHDCGQAGELVEEVAEENKSLLWFLLKQVRPGMDLSKVVLPTFILEPRSFLDKLSDSYYHADILGKASQIDEPYSRFVCVLRWYLSGLYKKPRGLKKPYNPVLGEVFRCSWRHPHTNTLTYYVAEQVSHHPPVSAFYVSNRKEGFVIEGSLLARSKFYGNSTSAILEGCARIHLLKWNESYITTAPYAHCKGIVIGTLSMELGGKVHIMCPDTGYQADVEFKLRSFLGGSEQTNSISGRIKKGKETVATIEGYWDGRIDIKDRNTGEESNLVDVSALKQSRLPRLLIRLEHQQPAESQRLWIKVSEAIANDDQVAATEQKTIIEEAQRVRARDNSVTPWEPRLFSKDAFAVAPEGFVDQGWLYKYRNITPWQQNELVEHEEDFKITSVTSSRGSLERMRTALEAKSREVAHSDTSDEDIAPRSRRTIKQSLQAINLALQDQNTAIEKLAKTVNSMTESQKAALQLHRQNRPPSSHSQDLLLGFICALVLQALLNWLFSPK